MSDPTHVADETAANALVDTASLDIVKGLVASLVASGTKGYKFIAQLLQGMARQSGWLKMIEPATATAIFEWVADHLITSDTLAAKILKSIGRAGISTFIRAANSAPTVAARELALSSALHEHLKANDLRDPELDEVALYRTLPGSAATDVHGVDGLCPAVIPVENAHEKEQDEIATRASGRGKSTTARQPFPRRKVTIKASREARLNECAICTPIQRALADAKKKEEDFVKAHEHDTHTPAAAAPGSAAHTTGNSAHAKAIDLSKMPDVVIWLSTSFRAKLKAEDKPLADHLLHLDEPSLTRVAYAAANTEIKLKYSGGDRTRAQIDACAASVGGLPDELSDGTFHYVLQVTPPSTFGTFAAKAQALLDGITHKKATAADEKAAEQAKNQYTTAMGDPTTSPAERAQLKKLWDDAEKKAHPELHKEEKHHSPWPKRIAIGAIIALILLMGLTLFGVWKAMGN